MSIPKGIFSERLRFLMGERGITQQQLADAIGVSQATVAKWLKGATPRTGRVFLLARFFGQSTEEFLELFPDNSQPHSTALDKPIHEIEPDQIPQSIREIVAIAYEIFNNPEKREAFQKGLIPKNIPKSLTHVPNMVTQADVKQPGLSVLNIMQRASRFLEASGSKVSLARELGVPRSRISDWLSGRRVPDGTTMIALLNWVLERESEK